MAVSHVGSMVRGVGFLGRLLGGAAAATSTTTTAAAASSLPLAAVAASGKFQQRTFSASSDQKEGDKSLLSKAADAVGTFLDGKVMEAKYIHPFFHENAELVGEDYNGNKYYEITKGVLYGRHRWVVYKDLYDYSPASVPPEWHGWLHNINDDAPSRVKFLEQSYKVPATSYKLLGYQPKGSYRKKLAFNTKKRNWRKYEAWTPSN